MRANASDLEIELTEREKALVSQINFNPSPTSYNADSWRPVADATEELTHVVQVLVFVRRTGATQQLSQARVAQLRFLPGKGLRAQRGSS